MNIDSSFLRLLNYCESENYKGWDPYDGLNSRIFNATPLKYWDIARLAWIQAFKRSSTNFRQILLVPKQHNSKAIGLFLNGYCNLFKLASLGDTRFGCQDDQMDKIVKLADLLLSMQNPHYSGACWGYNFDWQSRAFFLPKFTPTVVATSFAVESLLAAYEVTKNDLYLQAALSSAAFVINDLNRIDKRDDLFMFSYSPLDQQAVYNATLLGTKILSQVYAYTGDTSLKDLAFRSAQAVCNLQNEDGSFPHSDQIGQSWRDNFHTGFKLESLIAYQKLCSDDIFSSHIEKGFKYWVVNYFNHQTGYSYYYDRGMSTSLVDLHCAAQALPTFYKLEKSDEHIELINKIARWPIDNMFSTEGYFYFQKVGNTINKTPYMRWPNAWMFYGLSYFLLMRETHDQN